MSHPIFILLVASGRFKRRPEVYVDFVIWQLRTQPLMAMSEVALN